MCIRDRTHAAAFLRPSLGFPELHIGRSFVAGLDIGREVINVLHELVRYPLALERTGSMTAERGEGGFERKIQFLQAVSYTHLYV